jgi:hypothetical protein
MFIRFRSRGQRLRLAIVESRREAGRVRGRLVATLPSIPDPWDTVDRLTFWRRLHERFVTLGNRVDAATAAKFMAAIHERIPMAAADDQLVHKLAVMRQDAKVFSSIAEGVAEMIEGKRAMIARLQADIAELESARDQCATEAASAHDRVARLEAGEDVPGGLRKSLDPEKVLRRAGFGDADLRHLCVVGAMTEATHESYYAEILRRTFNEPPKRILARRFLRAQQAAKEEEPARSS